MPYGQQFCQHRENRRRCVAYIGHIGKHDLQPLGSASVQAIDRQEAIDHRLGSDEFNPNQPTPVTSEKLVTEIDRALEEQPSAPISTSPTQSSESAPAPVEPAPTTETPLQTVQTSVEPAESPALP